MMRRLSRVVTVAAIGTVVCLGILGVRSSATNARGPFTVPTSPTKECENLSWCYGIRGLWVVVPADSEATYLFSCPTRSLVKGKYLLGGTDAQVSSKDVRVWYDGHLGAPIGSELPGAGLLFHAVTRSGKAGSFRPILGCISLKQASGRSTLSARRTGGSPSASHSAPPAPNPRAVRLELEPGWDRTVSVSCLKSETLVGSWGAAAFGTSEPPVLPRANAITITRHEVGNTVSAAIKTSTSVPYLIFVQVGALCEP